MIVNLSELKSLAEIFRKLMLGYHISHQDHELYQSLSDTLDAYQAVFSQLGYELIHDPRGFFYFQADSSQVAGANKTAQRFALACYLLVEYYADQGKDPLSLIEDTTITRDDIRKLHEKYTDLLLQAEIYTAEELEEKVFKKMVSFGFANERLGLGFRLQAPVYRFWDVCLKVHEESQSHVPSVVELPDIH